MLEVIDGEKIGKTFRSRVKPTSEAVMHPKAFEKHQISLADLIEEQSFDQVYPKFVELQRAHRFFGEVCYRAARVSGICICERAEVEVQNGSDALPT